MFKDPKAKTLFRQLYEGIAGVKLSSVVSVTNELLTEKLGPEEFNTSIGTHMVKYNKKVSVDVKNKM